MLKYLKVFFISKRLHLLIFLLPFPAAKMPSFFNLHKNESLIMMMMHFYRTQKSCSG